MGARHIVVLAMAGIGLAVAATPVGVIRSSETFQLRGVPVSVAGVPSWPVVAGDDIATRGSQAFVSFRDGSRITLDQKSKAKIEEDGTFRLLEGTMWYKLAAGSTLRMASQSKLLQATPGVEAKATTLTSSSASASPAKSSFKPASLGSVSTSH